MTRRLVLALGILLVLVPLVLRVEVTGDVLRLLPDDAELADALQVARRFSGGDIVLLDVDGRGVDHATLQTLVRQLRAELEALPHVVGVHSGISLQEAVEIQRRLAPHAPAFLPTEFLSQRTSEAGVRAVLSQQLARLSGPSGSLVEQQLLRDPLALEQAALRQLAAGAPGTAAVGGMLELEPSRPLVLAYLDRSPALVGPDDPVVASLDALAARQPLPVRWFGGHRMAADTADTVRSDVQRAAGVGLAGLVLVLFAGFRTLRPLVGALVPLAYTALFLAAGAGLVSPLHGIQLGFVGVILGLAVDYWVHLYVAAARLDPGLGAAERLRAARKALVEIRSPLLVSSGSTVLVFLLLTLSSAPIVRDLGITGAVALVGALLGTVLLGPPAYALVGRPSRVQDSGARWPRIAMGVLAVVVGLAIVAPQATFNGDPAALLATSERATAIDAYFAHHGLTGPRGAPRA